MPLPAASDGLIWAEIEFKKTLAGRVRTLLYKPPLIWLNISLADGSPHRYRLIPDMAAAGFLLSPVIADNRAFATLATSGNKNLTTQTVANLKFSADAQSGLMNCYQSEISVRLYHLDFPLREPMSPSE
jgi:hypothetical protein